MCRPGMQTEPQRYPAHAKVASILTAVNEELHDVPLYYNLHDLCKTVHCSPPAADVFRSAIVNAGDSAQPSTQLQILACLQMQQQAL